MVPIDNKALEWARREIALATGADKLPKESLDENGFRKSTGKFYDEFYAEDLFKSAFKAFKSLVDDAHSGFSYRLTIVYFQRLLKGLPLTVIEDVDGIWDECPTSSDEVKLYQCNRYYPLFKKVTKDGEVTYSDNNRFRLINITDHDVFMMRFIVDEVEKLDFISKVTLPYMPANEPIKILCEFCLGNPKNDLPYDTVHIRDAYIMNEDGYGVFYPIGKFYSFCDLENAHEISLAEWTARKEAEKKRKEAGD